MIMSLSCNFQKKQENICQYLFKIKNNNNLTFILKRETDIKKKRNKNKNILSAMIFKVYF